MHGFTPFRELLSSLLPYTLIGKRLSMEVAPTKLKSEPYAINATVLVDIDNTRRSGAMIV
ncbi:hypothetical protein CDL15_Pgr004996 [Punica granatum]|nr:hypothetical protein CDL15_Pgr004996 [Punica granatum]